MVYLYGSRAKDCRVHHWLQAVEMNGPIPPYMTPHAVSQRNRVAHEAASLMQVLMDQPDREFAPPEIFTTAFGRSPSLQEVKRVSEALAIFEGLDVIVFQRSGRSRHHIKWR